VGDRAILSTPGFRRARGRSQIEKRANHIICSVPFANSLTRSRSLVTFLPIESVAPIVSLHQGPPNPTKDDDASILTEHVRNGPHNKLVISELFAGSRKASKRTLPYDLSADEIKHALPSPQHEDIRETKRPQDRLGCSCRARSGSNEQSMLAQMEGCLDHSIALTAGSTGIWTEDEVIKLKDAIQRHTVAIIGMQLLPWFLVERKDIVIRDGMIF
jgi:hypothetical protein